ncbi:MAG: hypothetical protein IKO42_01600 [Opitutales bacterium]|nr:hypothetical protein [Opitutales bacterium]
MQPAKKKKKTDYAALNSPFMRIPKMRVEAARAILDLKFKEIYELRGRAPEALFEDLKKIRINADAEMLNYFKLAVGFAEQEDE